MLEYQKSSAAAPKPRNWFGVGIFLTDVFALAGAGVGEQCSGLSLQCLCTNSSNQTFIRRSLWAEAVGR